MTSRELFLRHLAQTSPSPMGLEIVRAEGSLLFDAEGKEYIDLIGGISVANVGHRHPKVIETIKKQLDAYLHIMVYGEFVESPQVQYAKLLVEHLPPSLDAVYFTNSGAEATEGAMKLAKRITRRSNMIAFKDSYHGSTQGALSIMGDEYWRNAFRPLLPGILHLPYNTFGSLEEINENTACVIAESVQAESGIITPSTEWMQALRKKCTDTGTLLVLDEIQAGFGRTGKLWAFEHFGIVPDVLLLGKALGGGMPLGAFIAGKSLMDAFTENPVLGHITTFGGHPVSCTAGMAAMKVLLEEVPYNIDSKDNSQFPYWRSINLNNFEKNKSVIDHCLRNGVLTDWFLFAPHCLRISPALNIPSGLYEKALAIIEEGISNNV